MAETATVETATVETGTTAEMTEMAVVGKTIATTAETTGNLHEAMTKMNLAERKTNRAGENVSPRHPHRLHKIRTRLPWRKIPDLLIPQGAELEIAWGFSVRSRLRTA